MSERLFIVDNKRVWCVDQQTGEIVWMESIGGMMKGGAIDAVMLEGNRLFVCAERRMHCLDADTGIEHWAIDLEGVADNKVLQTRGHPIVNRTINAAGTA